MSLWDDALAAIGSVFADRRIAYSGAGLAGQIVPAILTDRLADDLLGTSTARTKIYEVQQALLPGRPIKGNSLVDQKDGSAWRVVQVTPRPDVTAWELAVEQAA